jgi:hypothetical protein
MSKISKVIGVAAFAVAFGVWGVVFLMFRNTALTMFPGGGYEVYALTDNAAGGYSTSDLTVGDSSIAAHINVRSGKAYPYAGIGFNLMSLNHRPSGYFDFSRFDSVAVVVTAGRMRTVTFRIMTNDPVYSRAGAYLTYRPLEVQLPVGASFAELKASLVDFKNKEWWLVAQGLDKDDGLSYFYNSAVFEVFNGESTLRGIPDDIELKSIRMWGENRDFQKGMFFAAGLLVFLLAGFVIFWVRASKAKQNPLQPEMEMAAKLLKTTDKSVAEIAIAVGEKSPSQFEGDFKKIYGKKPLDYRRENV